MSIKDLFDKANKNLYSASIDEIGTKIESAQYYKNYRTQKDKFVPLVDFSDPKNFAKFGSAEKYYTDSIVRIYGDYPYDGSLSEKMSFDISSSYLDKYVFDKLYPRTNGFVKFSAGASGWGTQTALSTDGFGLSSITEYILFTGSMNAGPDNTRVGANKYSVSSDRTANLRFGGSNGNTVEFWLKKDLQTDPLSTTSKEVVFDISNGESVDHAAGSSYGRFLLYLNQSPPDDSDPCIYVTYVSGAVSAATDIQIGTSSSLSSSAILNGEWNHYAISAINSGNDLKLKLYFNGVLNDTRTVANGAINEVTGALHGRLGSLLAPSNIASDSNIGYGKLSGSVDEFRFWRKERNEEKIGRYWFTQVGGGTNTDTSNTDLGVYFKFNEGIVGDSFIDSTVLDYSGRISNGTWIGYTSNSRNTGSAMVLSGEAAAEFADPIIYPSHSSIQDLLTAHINSGSYHDVNNNGSLYHGMPGWIVDEDRSKNKNNLLNLTQVMGSFFDELYLDIKELPKLKNSQYPSSSLKPYPFASRLLTNSGLNVADIFLEADELNSIASRDEKREFEDKIYNLKNKIYHNIYNNLAFIYKSKGTEKSFRNLIRCFGVDDELLKINLYADNTTYEFKDNDRFTVLKKKTIDFNNADRFSGTVFLNTGSAGDGLSFLSCSYSSSVDGIVYPKEMSVEADIYFPKKLTADDRDYFLTPFISSSLFGVHQADEDNPGDMSWHSGDEGNFQVFSVREQLESPHAYFVLTSSTGGIVPLITSSLFYNVYDNEKWNFSVVLEPFTSGSNAGAISAAWSNFNIHELHDKTSNINTPPWLSGSGDMWYILEFRGYNSVLGQEKDSFTEYTFLNSTDSENILKQHKRLFVGAHRTNFTGSTIHRTDVKALTARYWHRALSHDESKEHSRDIENYGVTNPYRPMRTSQYLANINTPQIETLVLNWDFSQVTGSDSSGEFEVSDFSSGSSNSSHGWFSGMTDNLHHGRGYGFLANDIDVVDIEYINNAKQKLPEIVNSSDMVEIISRDDEIFTRESRPINHFFAIEKSMYQTISEEMINMFATIKDFNNLIGDPVNRYRQNYKELEKLRQMFFERVGNTPDIEKYLEYYKWIDVAISQLIYQLVPASANMSAKIRNMVESHILERNKYWNKFPTLESKLSDPEAGIEGINRLTYSWKLGHRPFNSDEGKNCFYWNKIANRGDPPLASGDSDVDFSRAMIHSASLSATTRRWTTPIQLGAVFVDEVRGGNNQARAKKDAARNITRFGDPTVNYLETDASSVRLSTICSDDKELKKINYDFKAFSKRDNFSERGKILYPFGLLSSSVNAGYVEKLSAFKSNVEIEGLHSDGYGDFLETPLQSPFTERNVGGLQYRHQTLNSAATDTYSNRAEGWKLYFDTNKMYLKGADTSNINTQDTNLRRAVYYRDEIAKRPINIKNIRGQNHTKDYEIVQTSGMIYNNRDFIAQGGLGNLPTIGSYFVDLTDAPKFLRTKSGKHVFIERFSSPGGPDTAGDSNGGYGLDPISGEYSVNNSLNYRNALVREYRDIMLRSHSGPFGYETRVSAEVNSENYLGSASYHKTNRNVGERPVYSDSLNTTLATGTMYDNWFIQHAIPRSDRQYQWVAASLKSGEWNPISYASSSSDYSFISSSAVGSCLVSASIPSVRAYGPVTASVYHATGFTGALEPLYDGFSGFNHHIYENITSSLNTVGGLGIDWASFNNGAYNTSYLDGFSEPSGKFSYLNTILNKRNGPHQYPTWKQIRSGENAVFRTHSKSNIVTVNIPNGKSYISGSDTGLQAIASIRQGRLNFFTEPPITSRYKPLVHVVTTEAGHGRQMPVALQNEYGNNMASFANPELVNIIGTAACDKQVYDRLLSLYNTYDPSSPINEISSIVYSEEIYPKEVNKFLQRSRTRENFVFNTWKSFRSLRNSGTYVNSQGKTVKGSIWPLDARLDFDTANVTTGSVGGEGELLNGHCQYFGEDSNPAPMADFGETVSENYTFGAKQGVVVTGSWNDILGTNGYDNWTFFGVIGNLTEDTSLPAEIPLFEMGAGRMKGYLKQTVAGSYNIAFSVDTDNPGTYEWVANGAVNFEFAGAKLPASVAISFDKNLADADKVAIHVGGTAKVITAPVLAGNILAVDNVDHMLLVTGSHPADPFIGTAADFSFFSGTLSTAQIADLSAYGRGNLHKKDITNSTIAWWRLGSGYGLTGSNYDTANSITGEAVTINDGDLNPDNQIVFFDVGGDVSLVDGVHDGYYINDGSWATSAPARNTTFSVQGQWNDNRTGDWRSGQKNGALYARRFPMYDGDYSWPLRTLTGAGGPFRYVHYTGSQVFAGDTFWTASATLGKAPTPDTYGEFAENIRGLSKDFSVIPEFRISEHMNYYFDNYGGNFLADNNGFLSLTGSYISSSLEENFYKEFSHSDFLKYFDVVKGDHEGILKESSMKLKCRATMKFLPYEGFYPAERTLQLAQLFSQSYGDYVRPRGYDSDDDTYWRSFLSPFFGPGILYNSIKSGMAVGWPIYGDDTPPETIEDVNMDPHNSSYAGAIDNATFNSTTSTWKVRRTMMGFPISASTNMWRSDENGDDISLTSTNDERNLEWYTAFKTNYTKMLPFESLVEPENHLIDIPVWDIEPHYSSSLRTNLADHTSNQAAMWTGDGKEQYKLSMHNFLAEVPTFFLKDENMSSFVSNPVPPSGIKINEADAKSYFGMDVVINNSACKSLTDWTTRASDETYRSKLTLANSTWTKSDMVSLKGTHTQMYERDSAFGPPWVYDHEYFTGMDRAGYHFGFEPYTPAYQNGFGLARMIFYPYKGSGTYSLDEIQSALTMSYVRMPTDKLGINGFYTTTEMLELQTMASIDQNILSIATNSYSVPANPETRSDNTYKGMMPATHKAHAVLSASMNWQNVGTSVNLLGKTKNKKVIYKKGQQADFEVDTVEDNTDSSNASWVIQPKWETPIFNFKNVEDPNPQSGKDFASKGMWHQFGDLPVGQEGVWLTVKDLPSKNVTTVAANASASVLNNFYLFDDRAENVMELQKQNAKLFLYIANASVAKIALGGQAPHFIDYAQRHRGLGINIPVEYGVDWGVTSNFNIDMADALANTINSGTIASVSEGLFNVGIHPRHFLTASIYYARFEDTPYTALGTQYSASEGIAVVEMQIVDKYNRLQYNVDDGFEISNLYSNHYKFDYPNYVASGESGNHIFTSINAAAGDIYAYILAGADGNGKPKNGWSDIFFTGGKNETVKIKSLADLLGFEKVSKRLGTCADQKVVREAVVAVPFKQVGNKKIFFDISQQQVDVSSGRRVANNDSPVADGVQDMVEKMKRYVFPPKFDFVTNENIKPFAMYIFEFEHILTKEDLRNIWQNLPPQIADSFEVKDATVEHDMLPNELLGEDVDPSLRWMVFKVKQQAEKNYFAKTLDESDDDRFNFKFKTKGAQQGRKAIPEYSYNWPYDFFSLVELAKIDAQVVLENKNSDEE